MAISPSSSVQRARERLAERLRDIRLDAGLTARALSAEAAWHEANLAAIGYFRSNSLDGLSSLSSVPVANLLLILVGMPLIATGFGWLLAGRDPAGITRQPLE